MTMTFTVEEKSWDFQVGHTSGEMKMKHKDFVHFKNETETGVQQNKEK